MNSFLTLTDLFAFFIIPMFCKFDVTILGQNGKGFWHFVSNIHKKIELTSTVIMVTGLILGAKVWGARG